MKNEAISEFGFGAEGSIGDARARDLATLKEVIQGALCRAFEWVAGILMA
jgi:hypothetical protein